MFLEVYFICAVFDIYIFLTKQNSKKNIFLHHATEKKKVSEIALKISVSHFSGQSVSIELYRLELACIRSPRSGKRQRRRRGSRETQPGPAPCRHQMAAAPRAKKNGKDFSARIQVERKKKTENLRNFGSDVSVMMRCVACRDVTS